MSNRGWIITCIVEALIIISLLLAITKKPTVTSPDVIIKETVRDSIIRDSIYIEIEKINEKIVYVEKQFTKDSSDIMSANDSTLFSTFSRYIEDYNNK
jgi:hypothetical protein